MQAALLNCRYEIRDTLEKVLRGEDLSFGESFPLATADDSALDAIVAFADALRHHSAGDAITYVVNRNINFTNVCFVGCSFCGFGKGPGAPSMVMEMPDPKKAGAEASNFMRVFGQSNRDDMPKKTPPSAVAARLSAATERPRRTAGL